MDLSPMDAVDLLPGERILWQGRPVRHRIFWPTDTFLIPFSLLWWGFAIFWEMSVLRSGPLDFMVIWGAGFVAFGAYLVVGRFFVRALASRRTRYVLTDRRVVVTGGATGRRTKSDYLDSLPPPLVTERDDRSGTLAFGDLPSVGDIFTRGSGSRSGWQSWSAVPSTRPLLVEIPEVRHVRGLVADAQMRLRTQAT